MKKIYIFELEKRHNKKQFRDSVVTKSLSSALEYINKHHLSITIHDIEIKTLNK
tara:strand:- start:5 stop:166 length:162 start_codon:yes stop_codon:yes gene_type:complete